MNDFYRTFVKTAHRLAMEHGLTWDLPCDSAGVVPRHLRWDLAKLRGLPPPPVWLSQLGFYPNAVAPLNGFRTERGLSSVRPGPMPTEWQDFLKAVLLNEVLVKQNKPQPAIMNYAAPMRILATCAGELKPWELTADAVQLAYNVALSVGESGKSSLNLATVVRTLIDSQHLADCVPLAGFCKPYASGDALAAQARADRERQRASRYRRTDRIRTELAQRKRASQLPEQKAFWELVRIIFTETPRSFSDAVRFTQVKLAVVTGFRAGENALVPADWMRWREHLDFQGRPAGERGGISRSLMVRHFAAKQAEDEGVSGVVLYETAQHVPPMFEELVLDALGTAARLTAPLRERLRRQTETGRLLPEFASEALVPAWELYNRVSGTVRVASEAPLAGEVAKYRTSYDLRVLEEIRGEQIAFLSDGAISREIRNYWRRHALRGSLVLRDRHGNALSARILDWREVWLRVGEVEQFIRREMPTKLPDIEPFHLADGSLLYPHDLFFATPERP